MTADQIDPDTRERIHQVNARRVAALPPLTDEQKELIARILGGNRLRGGNDAA